MNQIKSESESSIENHLAWLYGRINYERQLRVTPRHFKLKNMRELLHRLDNPHLDYSVVHVAGTKGKGSVSTMIGSILTAAGQKTGVYTSPHLETIHQRMAIDGALITDEQLIETLECLKPVIEAMDRESAKEGWRPLTFFEITTAAAFCFFSTQNCDSVVLEVGLGGRLDSTNICQPTTCVITNISVDHTRQLGSTVDKIAFEKAGIIKTGIPVVSGTLDPVAAEVIEEVANEKGSPLFVLNRDVELSAGSDAAAFSCSGNLTANGEKLPFRIDDINLRVLGHHQQLNSALAIAAVKLFDKALSAQSETHRMISDDEIKKGLFITSLTGRAEVISSEPTIIVDMAHNVASIGALVDTLKDQLPQWDSSTQKTIILATSRDKDAPGMLRPLVENFDEVILTKYQSNPRGREIDELQKIATDIRIELIENQKPAATISVESTPGDAWNRTWGEITPKSLLCITGSAFLVAELRPIVLAASSS